MASMDLFGGVLQGIVNNIQAGSGISVNQSTGTVTVTNTGAASTLTGICPYSYVIRAESGTYNAYNGQTGSIEITSTIAHTVINQVISTLSSGGAIYVAKGTYPLSSYIRANSINNIEITGEGMELTVFECTDRAYPGYSFFLQGTSVSPISGWYIHDFTIDDREDIQSGTVHGHIPFRLEYVNNSNVERIKVKNVQHLTTWAGGGFGTDYCNSITFFQCVATLPPATIGGAVCYGFDNSSNISAIQCIGKGGSGGLNFYDGCVDSKAIGNYFTRNRWAGIVCYMNAHRNIAMGNHIYALKEGGFSYQGMYIGNASYPESVCTKNVFAYNRIYDAVTGIIVGTNNSENQIIGNMIDAAGDGGGIIVQGPCNLVSNNYITRTHNGVGIKIAGSSLYVAHHNLITNNYMYEPYVGIKFETYANSCQISNNVMYGGGTCAIGLDFDDGSNNYVTHNKVEGIAKYIDFSSGCDNNILKYNDLTGMSSGYFTDNGSNNILKDNIGYITENYGLGTLDSGQTLDTGLATHPTYMNVTPIGSGNETISFAWNTIASGNASVTIHHSVSGSSIAFSWEAKA